MNDERADQLRVKIRRIHGNKDLSPKQLHSVTELAMEIVQLEIDDSLPELQKMFSKEITP